MQSVFRRQLSAWFGRGRSRLGRLLTADRRRPMASPPRRILLALVILVLLLGGATAVGITHPQLAADLGLVESALCSGNCQGCYCDQIVNGSCYVNGRPSGCIGCVGSCTGDDSCQCRAGPAAGATEAVS